MSDTPLIRSLRAAVAAVPGDVTLRLHLAEQLLVVGDAEGAAEQAAEALRHEPGSGAARDVLGRALGTPGERREAQRRAEAEPERAAELKPEAEPTVAKAEPELRAVEPWEEPNPIDAERVGEVVFDWAAAEVAASLETA